MNKLDDMTNEIAKLAKFGELNKKDIADRVFASVERLRKFKDPGHPLVCERCDKWGRRNRCPEDHFKEK